MIVYLHGFNSSPASHKARLLEAAMRERGLGECYRCPALPPRPDEAFRLIEQEIARAPSAPTLVGSSLGGFYATCLAERHGLRAVLLNPAVEPWEGLRAYLGPQRNLYTGQTWELTEAELAQLHALAPERVDPERYLLIVETGDELLDWRVTVRRYEGARMVIRHGGDHTLQSFPEHVARILAFAGLCA